MSEQALAPAAPARRGFLRFLFRTWLGVLLLVLGVLGLCIGFAPSIAEQFVGNYASSWFSEHYRGQLTLGKVDLNWSGPQSIQAVELKDPSGARVAMVSATLPGLWSLATSGGTRLGKIEIVGEANLNADAAGRTNLESALEPREAAKETPKTPGDSGSSANTFSQLDAELDVHITSVRWTDEHTRELGAPFVLEDVSLAAVLRPDQPMTAKMRGTLTGSVRSELSFDARIEHPFDAPSSATPPNAELSAQVANLPTALLDAVMRQGGRLKTLLGEDLSLQLDAKGSVQQGSFDLHLDTPHGRVHGSARLVDGMLRSEGEGFSAEFDMQQEFVELAIRPMLPVGAELLHVGADTNSTSGPGAARLEVALTSFEAPLGAYLEALAKGQAQTGLDALLAGIRARWSANLGEWRFRGSSALAGRGPLIVRGLVASGELKAAAEDSSLQLAFSASNPSREYNAAELSTPQAKADMAFGQAELNLTVHGGATLVAFTPSAALQPLHARVHMQDVPTALFDSIAVLDGDLIRALGPKLTLDVDATTSIEAAAKQDLTWAELATRWRELAARVDTNATLDLRGSPTGEALKSLGGQTIALHRLAASARLAPKQPVELSVQLDFETPAEGHFEGSVSLGELFADPASKTPLRFSLASKAHGLPARAIDALTGQGTRVQKLLGNLLAFDATAQGTLEEGVARIDLSSEKSQVLLVGRMQNGVFTNLNEPVLSVSLQPDSDLFDELVAPYLPKGSKLAFAESRGVFGLNVTFLALPVSELIAAAKKSPADAISTALARTRLDAIVGVREFVYEDEALTAAGERIDKLALQLDLELRPGEKAAPTRLSMDLALVSPSWGEKSIDLHVDVPDAPQLLGIKNGAAFAPIAVRLAATRVPTALLDAYTGGKLRDALGPQIDLTLGVQASQVDQAPFAADAKLELSAAGGKSTLAFKAQVQDPFDKQGKDSGKPRLEGTIPDFEATLDVGGAGALLAFAPANARDLLRELCGETIAARIKLAGTGKADIALDAGGIALSGALNYTDRVLSTIDAVPLVLKVSPNAATLQRLLADKLPAGASLKLSQPPGAISVQLTRLRAPLGRFFEADPSLARSELIENLAVNLDASLPAFTYTHPPPADGAAAAVASLRDVQVHARMQPGAAANLDVTGKIDAAPPGGLEVHVIVEKPAGFAVEPPAVFPAPGSRATLTAKLTHFPSALLDVLAEQNGLLVDVLGPDLDANVRGVYPDAGAEPLHADLHSSLGDVALNSRIVDGVVVSEGEQGLDAKVGLTPLFSKRIIGSLVPMLVQVKQDDPTKRTLLTGRKLSLPMDADLSKFSGDMILDLGAVDYQFLPGISQALSLGGKDFTAKNTVIKPIAIKVTNGIARYDAIPIKISGREINFKGSANLAQKSFELSFALPLEMLGSKVEAQLESVRNVLDPKLEVPLELSGSWTNPKLRLGKGFLDKVLKDAARGELEKGLGGLLGGKKKKKDG